MGLLRFKGAGNKTQRSSMKILVTGGAGFIGSRTCVELLGSGYEVVIVDNLLNSKASVVDRVATITGKGTPTK